ncbi:MAG: glutaminyl-peptide cyclotransferase [Deltaproteobacteria bacterium]|nr:glutaminyl-peptide cyclotransferase [Deltaproteobacteria bacterium]
MNDFTTGSVYIVLKEKLPCFIKRGVIAFLIIILSGYAGFVLAKDASEKRLHRPPNQTTRVPVHTIEVLNIFHHDSRAFTQGLIFYKDFLYESTGLYGKSAIFKKDVKTAKILKKIDLSPRYFGEGMAILERKIYLLTYRNERGFIYDVDTFRQIGHFKYSGEGWGLTTDGKHLIMSNGSSIITFHKPDSFSILHRVRVHDGDRTIDGLNELEYIKDEIWANIFTKNIVARISPETGTILGWIDMTPLIDYLDPGHKIDVLNGIAYDKRNDRIFVTGKFWPMIFEIRLSSKQ